MRFLYQSAKQTQLVEQFDELIRANWHRLSACARKNADDTTDIDLILSDTLKKIGKLFYQGHVRKDTLIRYAMRSIRNAAREQHSLNTTRRHAENRFGQEEAQRKQGQSPEELFELQLALREVLRKLPEKSASVLTMKIWEKKTFADIAASFGVTESTARRYYETAIDEARKLMTQN